MNLIEVKVVRYLDRTNFVLRYIDHVTGRQMTRSAKTNIRRDAERAALEWERRLLATDLQRHSWHAWVLTLLCAVSALR